MPAKEFLDLRERLAKVDAGGNLVADGLNEYLHKLDTGEIPAETPEEKPVETVQAVILKGRAQ